MRVLLLLPALLVGTSFTSQASHAADFAQVSGDVSAVQQDGRMTLVDHSVMGGQLLVEIEQPDPPGIPVAPPADVLARVGGNIYALAGNDGGIVNASGAKTVD